MTTLKIALVQLQVSAQSLSKNIEVACDWIDKAHLAGADLVLFPEIHLMPFFPQYEQRFDLAQAITIDSPEVQRLQAHCRNRGIACVPNVYLRQEAGCYDTSLVIDKEGVIVGQGSMVHIAQQPMFYEQDYYDPAPDGFRVMSVAGVKIGIVVCFDRHYPESFRSCASQGAHLVVVPTANVEGEPFDIFDAELQSAAYQNNIFIAMTNRVGQEDQMNFLGLSTVVNPHGKIVAQAGQSEELLIVELNIDEVHQARQQRPYIELLRPDMYINTKPPKQ